MKLAYISYVFGEDGGAVHTREIISALSDLGHDVHTLWLNRAPGSETPSSSAAEIRARLKRHLSRWAHEPREVLLNAPFFLQEARFLRRVRPDVAIIRQTFAKISGVMAARLLGIPVLLEVNAPGALEAQRYFHEHWHLPYLPQALDHWAIVRAGAIVTVSEALREHICRVHGVPLERMSVNPNGVDPARFDPVCVPPAEIPGLRKDDAVVGFCGTFQTFHGVERLVTLAEALADIPGLRFLFVGDGPERPRLARLLERGPAYDRVTFAGRVPHHAVPSYLARMDIGVMPMSNFYGSPIKVIEYMAMGIPVVGPRLGPLQEVVEEGRHGLLFPPDSVEDLVSSVRRLALDRDLRARLGAAGRSHVLGSLTWRHNAQRVEVACRHAARPIMHRTSDRGTARRSISG